MKICKTCGRPEGELRDDDEPKTGDESLCWDHVNHYAECYSPRELVEASHALALEQLDEVTRERDAARRALADVAKDRDAVQLESARWQIRAEKAEAERDEVGVQLEAARERLAKMERLAGILRNHIATGTYWPEIKSALAALDDVPGDEGVPG